MLIKRRDNFFEAVVRLFSAFINDYKYISSTVNQNMYISVLLYGRKHFFYKVDKKNIFQKYFNCTTFELIYKCFKYTT